MTVNDIYTAMEERGLARSRRHFSRILGMSPNYAADTKLARCSPKALLALYKHLAEVGQADLQAQAFTLLLAAEERDGAARAVRP